MVGILRLAETEFPDRHVVVHIGWPVDSWLDRIASGVKLLSLQRLPRMFPGFGFIIRYTTKVPLPSAEFKPDDTAKKTKAQPPKRNEPSSTPTRSGPPPE